MGLGETAKRLRTRYNLTDQEFRMLWRTFSSIAMNYGHPDASAFEHILGEFMDEYGFSDRLVNETLVKSFFKFVKRKEALNWESLI